MKYILKSANKYIKMVAKWTEVLENKNGTWMLYYDSNHSCFYPYRVELLNRKT